MKLSKNSFNECNNHEIKKLIDSVVSIFCNYFAINKYQQIAEVAISANIDNTVRFIGSHISVMKPYIINKNIPPQGLYMTQECIRTQNLSYAFDYTYQPRWGSHFTSLGTLKNVENINDVLGDLQKLFYLAFEIDKDLLLVRINSQDTDLYEACKRHFPRERIEIDTQPLVYYRHKIGVEGVYGRSFNFAIANSKGDFADIGNIILIESEHSLGLETAIGATTFLKQLYDADHVYDFYPFPKMKLKDPSFLRKIQDSIVVSTKLYREGLRPKSSNNKTRLLKKYVTLLSYYRSRVDITLKELKDLIRYYENYQFNDIFDTATEIIDYLQSYEEFLRKGDVNNSDDKIIKNALR